VNTDLLFLRGKIYVNGSFTRLVFFCYGLPSARNCCIRQTDICIIIMVVVVVSGGGGGSISRVVVVVTTIIMHSFRF
jgi:hypothetical protein